MITTAKILEALNNAGIKLSPRGARKRAERKHLGEMAGQTRIFSRKEALGMAENEHERAVLAEVFKK